MAVDSVAGELALASALESIGPLDEGAMAETAAHLDRLTKPPGSLGRLETLAIQLAGITGDPVASVDRRRIVVAAGDHGVTRRGVSAYPSDVTAQMVANFVDGGAAINVLGRAAGATVTVLDVGIAGAIPERRSGGSGGGRLVRARVRRGTGDITVAPAMTRPEALQAIDAGMGVVDELREGDGVDLLGVGEMGIGNTTPASAVVAALTRMPVASVTGRGTGVDDEGLRRKIDAIERALALHDPDPDDPIGVLAAVGGLEIAALVGVLVRAAAARVPVVLDGFITGAAALVAACLQPRIADRLIASHQSLEPGHAIVLERLGRRPLLDLELRLGEGTGAVLAMHLIVAACRLRDEMATFESAAVSGPA
jgi:nicotinate-nucleotide--dimethylbenzimidazole phosphoribosyltransferase